MTKNSPSTAPKNTIRGNTKTTRENWLKEAQKVLIEEGVEHVKVGRLAKNLAVTRGGFYWFFKTRQDILDTILTNWMDSKNDPLTRIINDKNDTPLDPLIRFFSIVVHEQSYSPALDSAIRDWARTSSATRDAVDLVDDRRIKALTEVFLSLAYEQKEAFIRARILYYHQIGYYAMDVHETKKQRLNYLPVYFKQLTGFELPNEALQKFKR